MATDWTDDPEWKEWKEHVKNELIPMIDGSAFTMTLVPGKDGADVKFAVELGLSIMLNKPIVLACRRGMTSPEDIPAKLRQVADGWLWIGEDGQPEPDSMLWLKGFLEDIK